jgi:hypothetical protein
MIGEPARFVYYIGYENNHNQEDEKESYTQEELLDDIEFFLRAHRPEIFNDEMQSS